MAVQASKQVCKIWKAYDRDPREWLSIGDLAGNTAITDRKLKYSVGAMTDDGLLASVHVPRQLSARN